MHRSPLLFRHNVPFSFNRSIILFLLISLLLGGGQVASQPENTVKLKGNIALDADTRQRIVTAVTNSLREYYIDPNIAKKMSNLLKKNLEQGHYNTYTKRDPFIRRLTKDMRSINNDLHLGVWPIETSLTLQEVSEEESTRLAELNSYLHFGLPVAQRLHGNIGYLEILEFVGSESTIKAAVAAMNYLSSCDALIIDLRRCGGGEGYLGQLIMNYLFAEPTHYTSIYTRHKDELYQVWSMPYTPGPKLVDIPVYILQSRRTASAAEGMSYSLQSLRRATIVGELSRGAANTVDELNFPDLSICVAVSVGQVINPTTGTSWEGVGVAPDIDVPADQALLVACSHAAKLLLKTKPEVAPYPLRQWAFDFYQARLEPITLSETYKAQICGEYRSSVVVYSENGLLHMTPYGGEPTYTLIPLRQDEFAVLETEALVRVHRDELGNISSLSVAQASGLSYNFQRITKP